VTRAGRLHAPEIEVLVTPPRDERTTIELRAPSPGMFVPWIAQGDLVTPGAAIGELVVLGRASALVVPRTAEATGLALRIPPATHPVGYGDVLVALDPSLHLATGAAGASAAASSAVDGLVFHAPTSGRFYGRPAPDKPPFVAEGTQLTAGTTICLLEVMKTFHRVTYGGPGLPDTARVRRVLVADGADVNAGDPLLALE
jgi:acetyl-CoA carboxylase biotin carboxyl carrier protein